MEVAIQHFASGTFAALTAKLASSIDDVVWLAAFLTPNLSPKERYANAITYASVCFIQTVLAYFISRGGEAALDKIIKVAVSGSEEDNGGDAISSEKVLTLFAGFALFVYSIKLGIEYYHEEILGEGDDEDADEEEEVRISGKSGGYGKVQSEILDEPLDEDAEKGEANKEGAGKVSIVTKSEKSADYMDNGPLLSESTDDDDEVVDVDIEAFDNIKELEAEEIDGDVAITTNGARKPYSDDPKTTFIDNIEPLEIEVEEDMGTSKSCLSARSRTLPIVAFLGSLDDLTLFVPMLVGKTFGIFELIIGSTVAGMIIVLICLFITKCEMLSNFLQRIPLAVIVVIFSIVLLVKGSVME